MDTEWYDIPQELGLLKYQIRKDGQIRNSRGKIMAQTLMNGYFRVGLRTVKGTNKSFSNHRLVALTFIPIIEGKDLVDHINSDRMKSC